MQRKRILQHWRLAGCALFLVLTALVPWKFDHHTGFAAGNAYGYAQSPIVTKFVDALPLPGYQGATITPLYSDLTTAAGGAGNPFPNENGQFMPIAQKDPSNPYPGSDTYVIGIEQFRERVHTEMYVDSSAPGTLFRGFADLTGLAPSDPGVPHFGGPLIIARRGTPVRITYRNLLTDPNFFLPTDPTLMGGTLPTNAVAIHLHGGFNPWISDGTPFQYFGSGFGANKLRGASYQPVPDMPAPADNEYTVYYPNQSSARLEWYHDHMVSMTRLNPYVGLAAGYLITDGEEDALINASTLPNLGIPLIIQDKTFVDPLTINTSDPSWATHTNWGQQKGDLWYPHIYEPNQNEADGSMNPSGRWDLGSWVYPPANVTSPLPPESCVPEFFADTPLINGTAYPYLKVQKKRYRFRILNGSNARNYNLQIYYEAKDINTQQYTGEPDLSRPGPAIIQVGNEGGFLPQPAELNKPPVPFGAFPLPPGATTSYTLWLGPAERADIIVDFSATNQNPSTPVADGDRFILYSDAPAPAPMGDPRNDYFTGGFDFSNAANNPFGISGGAPMTDLGKGPNTRTLMEFQVVGDPASPDAKDYATTLADLQNSGSGLPHAFARSQPAPLLPTNTTVNVRTTAIGGIIMKDKTLNEEFDSSGRLIQMIGDAATTHVNNQGTVATGLGYAAAPTEKAFRGQTQIWNIINNTGDVHPIHVHLVNAQLIGRLDWAGNFTPPDPNETGWKETIRMNPGTNTIIAMKFDLPTVPFKLPMSIRPLDPTMMMTGPMNPMTNFGHEYVWHCHILEHEEHDMMRPLSVLPPPALPLDLLLLSNAR